jgi:thiamine-phosphate pyrophosphorylase
MKRDFSRVRLCVLVAEGVSRLPFDQLVREVIAGGADCIQLREKGISDRVLLERARACRRAVDDAGAACVLIVNDRPDIAALAGADGVHVGQDDLPPAQARRIAGPDAVVGVSTHEPAEIAAAEAAGADYLGIGAVFLTATKDIEVRGLDYVRAAARTASRPFLAIGGITLDNVGEVIRAGAPGVAVFSAVVGSDDPRSVTRAFKDAIEAALAGKGA